MKRLIWVVILGLFLSIIKTSVLAQALQTPVIHSIDGVLSTPVSGTNQGISLEIENIEVGSSIMVWDGGSQIAARLAVGTTMWMPVSNLGNGSHPLFVIAEDSEHTVSDQSNTFTYSVTATQLAMKVGNYEISSLGRGISNPIFPRETGPAWDDYFVAEPFILNVGPSYYMWYYGTGQATSYEPMIGMAASGDGVSWDRFSGNPVLSTGDLIDATASAPQKPWVVWHNNRFYMYYRANITIGGTLACTNDDGSLGVGSSSYTGIGLAISRSSNPYGGFTDQGMVLVPEKCSDEFKVDTPSVIYDQEEQRWKMWYSVAKGARNEPYSWQYATSADGSNWTKRVGDSGLPVEIAVPPTYNSYLSGGLGGMSITKSGGVYYNLFNAFTGYDPNNPSGSGYSNIFYASSTDGLSWNFDQLNPIIKRGDEEGRAGDFDSKQAYRPNFIVTTDDACYVYYNGKGGDGGETIGAVTTDCVKTAVGTPVISAINGDSSTPASGTSTSAVLSVTNLTVGNSLVVWDGSLMVAMTLASGTGETMTVSGLELGDHTFTATAIDSANNISDPSAAFVYTRIEAQVLGTAVISSVNGASVSPVYGKGSSAVLVIDSLGIGNSLQVWVGSTEMAATISNSESLSVGISGLQEGSFAFKAWAINSIGESTVSTAFTYIRDSTPPLDENSVLTQSQVVKGGGQVTITAGADPNEVYWLAPSGTTTFAVGSSMTSSSPTSHLTAPAVGGTYYLYVIDRVGNVSNPSTATVTVDTVAPTYQNSVLPENQVVGSGVGVSLTMGAEESDSYWLAPLGTAIFSTGSSMTSTVASSGIRAPTAGGTYHLFVIDQAGNVSAASTSTVTVDTVAPQITVTIGSGTTMVKSGSLSIGISTNEAVATVPKISINQVGSSDVSLADMTVGSDNQNWNYTYSVYPSDGVNYVDGRATIQIEQVADAVGNTSSATVQFTIDTLAPTTENTILSVGQTVAQNATVTLATTTGDPYDRIWLAPVGTSTFSVGSSMTMAVGNSEGNSTSITAPVAEGNYHLYVMDMAGNVSTASTAEVTVVQGVVEAPELYSINGSTATTIVSQNFSPDLVFNGLGLGTSLMVFDGESKVTQVLTVGTSATIRVEGVEEMTHIFGGKIADSVGNTSPLSNTISYTVDLTAPTVPQIVSINGDIGSSVTGTGSSAVLVISPAGIGDRIKVYLGGTEVVSVLATGTSMTTTISEGLKEGINSLTAKAADTVDSGNESEMSAAKLYIFNPPGTVMAPTFSVGTGVYHGSLSVEVAMGIGTSTFYSLGGGEPGVGTSGYSGAISIPFTEGGVVTLKAVSRRDGIESLVTTAIYSFNNMDGVSVAGNDLGQLVNSGAFVTGPSTTMAVGVTISVGQNLINLPKGEVFGREDNVQLDPNQLSAAVVQTGTLNGIEAKYRRIASLQWGLAGIGLHFASPITISILVGGGYNGQDLLVMRSVSGNSGWSSGGILALGRCRVSNGYCSFQADKASYYVVLQEVGTNQSNSNNSSSSSNNSGPPSCGDGRPNSVPVIYKIQRMKDTIKGKDAVKLIFVPASGPINYYFVAYDTKSGGQQYGVTFQQGYSPGSLEFVIGNLDPKKKYFFTVRPGNGCMPGDWSRWVTAKTGKYIQSVLNVAPSTKKK